MAKGGKELLFLESSFNTSQLGQYAWDWTLRGPDKGGWEMNLDTRECINMRAFSCNTGCDNTLARA